MNRFVIYILALGVFLTATSELVISGILNVISQDLNISLALSGQLVTVYSLSFAIGTPILISLTSRVSRTKLMLTSLLVFVFGSLIAFFSHNVELLMLSRIILGISSGVYIVVVFGVAAKLVPAEKVGSAVGTIVLGFSTSMIFGVPIGIMITNWLNWQAIFMILSVATLIITFVIIRLVPEVKGDEPVSFWAQFKVLGSLVIVSGLFITFFKETGNSVMMTYLIPYMQSILGVKASYASIMMLIFGIF
ncbi:MFS transporter [Paenibacillus sp. N1-5-1-14]|uniref:MFS transporter n=1 Tax=Paenibacillus radicibacter TaxID=2972488 RepID=UPI0021590D1C|nr:MFS transporter [Paenibacillus radicibacter]MCR8643766.1 MFS transporter [Paenibacillus radicibacter]